MMISALVYGTGFPFQISSLESVSIVKGDSNENTPEQKVDRKPLPKANHKPDTEQETLGESTELANTHMYQDGRREINGTQGMAGKCAVRRVIFPCLYQRKLSYAATTITATSHDEISTKGSHPIKKFPSMDSDFKLDNEQLSSSPTCVCQVSNKPQIQALPNTPFEGNPAHTKPTPPVNDTPIFTKRVASPFLPGFVMNDAMTHKAFPKKVRSILRNRIGPAAKGTTELESIPSMVSMSASESSQLDIRRRVSFDPRIWVSEFRRDPVEFTNTWYAPHEMDSFKREALELVRRHSEQELLPTGTGRLVRRPVDNHRNKVLFTCPALLGSEDDDEFAIQRLARLEIHTILVVDPRDVFSKLFAKAFRSMLPHANVVAVKSSNEAMNRIQQRSASSMKPFDLFLVEERLQLVQKGEHYQASGSVLIQKLSKLHPTSLMIGVSAHFDKDKEKLEEGGSHMTWPKPPPPLDKTMRDNILRQVLSLRGKDDSVQKYLS